MKDLFTPDERRFIGYFAQRRSTVNRIGFAIAVFVPIVWYASIGISRNDVDALIVAVGAAIAYHAWQLSSQLRYSARRRAIFSKLVNARGGAPDESIELEGLSAAAR